MSSWSNIGKKAAIAYFGASGLLGFYRGCQSYEYQFKNERKYTNSYSTNENFYYSKCFMEGLVGTTIYLIPFFQIIIIPKEIYRLETNLRNLESEKKTEYYYRLI